jgi:hypothetical protein
VLLITWFAVLDTLLTLLPVTQSKWMLAMLVALAAANRQLPSCCIQENPEQSMCAECCIHENPEQSMCTDSD